MSVFVEICPVGCTESKMIFFAVLKRCLQSWSVEKLSGLFGSMRHINFLFCSYPLDHQSYIKQNIIVDKSGGKTTQCAIENSANLKILLARQKEF